MYRMLLGTGLLLCGLFQQEAILRAQEPAFISGDEAVRFEQAPGFFHYAALCRTATEFSAAMHPARLPRESTESAVCWYVKATKMRNDSGKVDGSPMVDGKLVISAHHVRFIPHDPQLADLYVDFHPEETELIHHPGQVFAALGTTKILVAFRFSKLCPTCAPGTPIPAGTNPALLDQEFQLILDGIKHFDSSYHRIYALSAKIRVEVRAQNQPGTNDVPEAMRLYSDVNRQLAEVCPEPAKACIRSYAVYQTCIADHGGAKCGATPNCSAACPVAPSQVQNFKARACVQLDQQGASLIPDWTEVVRRKDAASVPLRPLPPGVLDIQFTSGPNAPAGVGCSVQASYIRASNPGVEVAGSAGSAAAIRAAKPIAVPAAKANTTAATTANIVSPPKPSAPSSERHTTVAAAAPGTATARPSVVPPAKPSAAAAAKPSTASAAKPAPVPAERPSTMASAKPSTATAGTVAATKPSPASTAKPAPVPAARPGTMDTSKPSAVPGDSPKPSTLAKASAIPAGKLGVTPPVRTDTGPVKSAVAGAKPSAAPLGPVKTAIPGGKSSAFPVAQSAATPATQSAATPATQSADPPVAPTEKKATTTLKIAPGTAEGMLLKKVPPKYPLEAKVARTTGTVTLNVTITKIGTVSAVEVESGPDLLQSAAVDAVKQWQFRPFSLLGEPVEFETTVHVMFGAGSPAPRAQAQGHP
ncbi:MAG TPA: TonB family protein [Terracidiphilus sp.]